MPLWSVMVVSLDADPFLFQNRKWLSAGFVRRG
jgi:hypothetical protein